MLASLLYGAAFVLVAWYQNLPALLGAIILLGISDSFGQPIQGSYYTELEEVKEFGDDRSVSVYNLFENAAQAAGPIMFSYILFNGVEKGLYLPAGILAVLAVIFVLGSIQRKKADI